MSDAIRHYAIFWTDPTIPSNSDHGCCDTSGRRKWARSNSKRRAIRHARKVNGEVYAVGYGRGMAWDAPTFRVSGDRIYPVGGDHATAR